MSYSVPGVGVGVVVVGIGGGAEDSQSIVHLITNGGYVTVHVIQQGVNIVS